MLCVAVLTLFISAIVCIFVAALLDGMLSAASSGGSPFSGNPYGQNDIGVAGIVGMSGFAILMLASYVTYIVLLLKMWNVVQDGRAGFTTGAAVALAVIPIVNLVGVFFGFLGLAKDLNRVASERGLHVRVSEGLTLAACICWVVGSVFGCIPIISCITSPIGLAGNVMFFIAIFQMASVSTAIVSAPGTPLPQAGFPSSANWPQ